ncbi:MAG: FAD:protein FMN transferase [Bacteroidales bacterium]|nr:FAD:protein FMN transferase [Bacteroidales bacterium]
MNIKRTSVQIIILASVFFTILIVHNRINRDAYVTVAGMTQGTTYHITYESRKGRDLKYEIDSLLTDFDHSLSTYNDSSIISRFNRNDTRVEADQKFRTVFEKAYEVYLKTDGAFDITVGPVVNAMGFGAGDTVQVDSALIDSLMTFIGMDKVSMQGNKLVKRERNLMLDVNAIAQGYSVDVVAEYLDGKRIRNYMVEIGGEVKTKGLNPNHEIWRIGIDKPVEGNMVPGSDLQAVIRLKDQALATSGNYRRFYEKDGMKYVHTIDPRTGYPVVSNLLSVTVIAEDCMTADAYATAFMVFGLERSVEFLNRNDFLEAYLVYADETGKLQVYISEDLSDVMEE